MTARDARDPDPAAAANRLFADADLVDYVTEVYGPVMGAKCEDIFNDAPLGVSGFADSIRRSLTRDYDALIQRGKYAEAMRDV